MNRWIRGMGLLVFCLLLCGLRTEASSQDIILKTEENKVEVTFGESSEEAMSMQLTVQVQVTEGNADTNVSFEFNDGIACDVKQYRYDRNTGTLNLYVSGRQDQNLFGNGEFSLGKVVLDPGGGSAAALVEVKSDSLQIVNRAYDLYKFKDVNTSVAQKVTAGNSSVDVPLPGPGEEEEPPKQEEGGTVPDTPGSGSTSSSGSGSGGRTPPPDQSESHGDIGIRTDKNQSKSRVTSVNVRQKPYETDTEADVPDDEEFAGDFDENASDKDESATEEVGAKEPLSEDTKDEDESEDRVDLILFAVLVLAVIAAGVVFFLAVQKQQRRQRRRERRRVEKQVGQRKKTGKTKKKTNKRSNR